MASVTFRIRSDEPVQSYSRIDAIYALFVETTPARIRPVYGTALVDWETVDEADVDAARAAVVLTGELRGLHHADPPGGVNEELSTDRWGRLAAGVMYVASIGAVVWLGCSIIWALYQRRIP
jgi:hypothetical protein